MASEEWRAPNDDSSSSLSGSTTSTADSRGHGHALPATGKSHRRARSGSIKSAQRWTQEEHELLLHVVERYGCKQWSTVARHMPGRTGKQCRERWINHRSPEAKKGMWDAEEEMTLCMWHSILGSHWARITRRLSGRTENTVKNRWNAAWRSKHPGRRHTPLCVYVAQLRSGLPSETALVNMLTAFQPTHAALVSSVAALADDIRARRAHPVAAAQAAAAAAATSLPVVGSGAAVSPPAEAIDAAEVGEVGGDVAVDGGKVRWQMAVSAAQEGDQLGGHEQFWLQQQQQQLVWLPAGLLPHPQLLPSAAAAWPPDGAPGGAGAAHAHAAGMAALVGSAALYGSLPSETTAAAAAAIAPVPAGWPAWPARPALLHAAPQPQPPHPPVITAAQELWTAQPWRAGEQVSDGAATGGVGGGAVPAPGNQLLHMPLSSRWTSVSSTGGQGGTAAAATTATTAASADRIMGSAGAGPPTKRSRHYVPAALQGAVPTAGRGAAAVAAPAAALASSGAGAALTLNGSSSSSLGAVALDDGLGRPPPSTSGGTCTGRQAAGAAADAHHLTGQRQQQEQQAASHVVTTGGMDAPLLLMPHLGNATTPGNARTAAAISAAAAAAEAAAAAAQADDCSGCPLWLTLAVDALATVHRVSNRVLSDLGVCNNSPEGVLLLLPPTPPQTAPQGHTRSPVQANVPAQQQHSPPVAATAAAAAAAAAADTAAAEVNPARQQQLPAAPQHYNREVLQNSSDSCWEAMMSAIAAAGGGSHHVLHASSASAPPPAAAHAWVLYTGRPGPTQASATDGALLHTPRNSTGSSLPDTPITAALLALDEPAGLQQDSLPPSPWPPAPHPPQLRTQRCAHALPALQRWRSEVVAPVLKSSSSSLPWWQQRQEAAACGTEQQQLFRSASAPMPYDDDGMRTNLDSLIGAGEVQYEVHQGLPNSSSHDLSELLDG